MGSPLKHQDQNDNFTVKEMEENYDGGINSQNYQSTQAATMIDDFTKQKPINKQSESQNLQQNIINQKYNNQNYINDLKLQNNKDGGELFQEAIISNMVNDQMKSNQYEDNPYQFKSCNSSLEDIKVDDHKFDHKIQIISSAVSKLKRLEDDNAQIFIQLTFEEYQKYALSSNSEQLPLQAIENQINFGIDELINTRDVEKIGKHLIQIKSSEQANFFLDCLKLQQFNIYEQLLDITSIFDNDKVFKQKQIQLETKATFKYEKLVECKEIVYSYLEENIHKSYKLYLILKSKNLQIMDPFEYKTLLLTKDRVLEELIMSLEDIHKDSKQFLLMLLRDLQIDKLIQKAFEFQNRNKLVGRKVLRILSTLSYQTYQKLYLKERMEIFLNEFQDKNDDEISQVKHFLESLQSQDNDQVINQIYEAFSMPQVFRYKFIKQLQKFLPEIYQQIPLIQLIVAKSTNQAKFKVQQFLRNLAFSDTKQNTNKNKMLNNNEMTELLALINQLDENVTELIIRNFKDEIVKRNIQFQMSRSQIQHEALTELRKILQFPKIKKTISDFYSIDYNFDPDQAQEKLIEDFQRYNIIDHENLIAILFYYVKSKLDPQILIHKFVDANQNFKLTRSRLIHYLLKIADQDLRIQLVISLSQYLPLPLLSIDCQQNDYEFQYEIINELFYVFEKQMSILNFGVLNNQKLLPPNIEKIVNQIFSKNFESESECCLNDGTIEIQFDYNLENPQYLPVATYHGPMTYVNLKQVLNLFDIFIIQQNSDEHQTPEQILQSSQFIEQINSFKKGICLIIVIECSLQYKYFQTYELSKNIIIIQSELLEKTNNNSLIVNLYQAIHSKIRSFRKDELNNYLIKPNLRLNSHFMCYEFIKEMNIEDLNIKQAFQNAKIIIDHIFQNKKDLHSQQFLPMNYLHKKYCKLDYQIQRDLDIDKEQKTQLIEKKNNILKALQAQKLSPLIASFNQIIENNQILGCLTLTSKIIRDFMRANLKPLYEARQEKQFQLQEIEQMITFETRNKSLEYKKYQLQDEINQITKDIESKTFSIEFIIRELYLICQYQEKSELNKSKQNFINFTNNQIKCSLPFEIIDGNNLQFVNGVFNDVFSDDVDIFVISIIGLQSTGKSLLLNLLFGTQFQSSKERCTKGVYGSIFEIHNNKTRRKMKILLLDTEGLLSIESRDENFDRRIVFYLLCVSHVVLICNQGEINREMSEIIQYAASTIQNLNTTYIKPKIYIIMNKMRNVNDQVNESIQGLITEISKIDNSKNSVSLQNRSEKSVVVLPFAFLITGSDEFQVNNPSPVFAQQLQSLKSRIFEDLKEYEENYNFKYTQDDWFTFASEFWQKTHQLRGFMKQDSLTQQKLDNGLIYKQKELINQFFIVNEDQNRKKIQADVQELLKTFLGEDIIKAQIIQRKVYEKVDDYYWDICVNIKKEYDNYSLAMSIDVEIKEKVWHQLLRNIKAFKQSWINDSKKMTQKFIQQKWGIISVELKRHLQRHQQYDLNEANELFTQVWNRQLSIIISQQKTIHDIRNENIERIKNEYKQECNAIQLIENQEIQELLEKYETSNNQIFIKELEQQEKNFLYHIKGQSFHPKIIIDQQKQVKNYLKMEPLVRSIYIKTTFKIFEVLIKIVDVDQLAEKMCQNMIQNTAILFGQRFEKVANYKEGIKDTYHQFNSELSIFNIRMKIQFDNDLQFLDEILNGIISRDDMNQMQLENNYKNQSKLFKRYKKAIIVYVHKTITSYQDYYENSNQNLHQSGIKLEFIVQKIKIQNNQGKQIEVSIDEFRKDFKKNYFVTSLQADEEVIQAYQGVIGFGKILVSENQQFNIIDDSLPQKTQHNARTYLWRYLDYLINTKDSNKSINQVGCEAKAMQLFLFQKIQLEKIVNDIEEIVLDKFKTDESKKFSNIKSAIEWLKQNQNLKSRNLFCKISNKIIQNIACEVNQLKGKIDKELEIYELKINYVGEKVLNLIALVLINALQEQLEMIEEQSALEELKKTEQSQKALFIAKLTSNDEQTDIALATKIIETYNQKLTQIIKTDTIKEYQKYLASNQSEFQIRDKIQNNLIDSALAFKIDQIKILTQINFQFGESQIGSKLNLEEVKSSETNCSDINLKDVIEGFMYPKTFLNRKFTEIWQSVTISKIRLSQKNASLQLLSSLNKIEEYMNDFYKLLETKKCLEPSMNLFTLNQQDDKSTQASQEEINMLKDLTQQCSAIYLQEMLLGTFTSSTNLTINGTSLKPYPGKYLPVSDDLSNTTLDDLFIAVMRETLNDEKISKIQTFISTVIQSITTQKQQEFSIEDFEMNGNYYSEFQTLFIGCTEHCPLCRQQCEKDHSNDPVNQRTHDCSKGHQLQCFGGNKDLNNNASVKTCSELKDDTIVKLNGSSQKWGSLKNEAKFKNWKFTQQSVQQVNIIKNKYSDIWNKFGPLFCEIYKDRHNIQISFVRSDNIQYREIHYLLLLDKSGSMKGQRWEDLKSGVLSFLKDLKSDILKQLHSKVSIILYDNSTTVLHSFAASDVTLINSLSIEPNGGTSFVNLFQKTYEYLTQHLSKADKHVVCVMTDGESAYPESELNQFLQNQELMDKISVSTILYSTTSSPVLQKIATTLKGTMKTALTSQQLEDSFKELIANVYV